MTTHGIEVVVRNLKTGATLGVVYPVQTENEALVCFQEDRQNGLWDSNDYEFVDAGSYVERLEHQERKWDNGQEMSDAFNEAFKAWKDSSPEVAEYVLSTGHSITGLQNMLFHFFKAGHDHAVES